MSNAFAGHLLKGTHAARPAATAVPTGTLYSCSDHGLLYQSDGAAWSTYATLGGAAYTDEQARDAIGAALVAGANVTITVNDAGDTITIASTDTTDPEVVRDTIGSALVAGANVTITVNDAGDTITIAAAAGGLTRALVGRNVIGASLEVMTNARVYLKKITLANDCLITSIDSYLDATSNVHAIGVALYADAAGVPGALLAANTPDGTSLFPSDAGWLSIPLGFWAAAGDYWLAVQHRGSATNPFQLAYDTAGSDRYFTVGGTWLVPLTGQATTDSTRNYSIRANTIR